MANSITASTASPYSLPQLQDVNYNASVAWPVTATSATTPVISFANLDWPTVGVIALSVYSTALTNNAVTSASYVNLQGSTDNSTWATIAPFSSSVLLAGSAATSQLVLLPPPAASSENYYVRAVGTTNGIGLVGTFGINTLF